MKDIGFAAFSGGQRVDSTGRRLIGIRGLLEWAFATECAQLDYDEIEETSGGALPRCGAEYRVFQQLALGKARGEGVRPDTSIGRSLPHDDAELVATVLRNTVDWWLAVYLADQARARTTPEWDLGPPRLVPLEWSKRNHLGCYGRKEVFEEIEYMQRGRKRRRQVWYTPCRTLPDAGKLAAARRRYLDWWGGLLSVSAALRGTELDRFCLTQRMPPMTPWNN